MQYFLSEFVRWWLAVHEPAFTQSAYCATVVSVRAEYNPAGWLQTQSGELWSPTDVSDGVATTGAEAGSGVVATGAGAGDGAAISGAGAGDGAATSGAGATAGFAADALKKNSLTRFSQDIGDCLLEVSRCTSPRTARNKAFSSRPAVDRCLTNALLNGLFFAPAPSDAICPGSAEKAMYVSGGTRATTARPRPLPVRPQLRL